MKKIAFAFTLVLATCCGLAQSPSSPPTDDSVYYRSGFELFPRTNRTMIGYRSNMDNKWAWEGRLGYTMNLIPQLNMEFSLLHRHPRQSKVSFYNGFGLTLDGITPGFQVPLGLEIAPLESMPNLRILIEASPKCSFSFTSALHSSFNGNIGVVYYKPRKKK